jgi:hypothetical protein
MLHYSINIFAQKAMLNILTRKKKMKKILKAVYCFFESMARARAASYHARHGNYKAAQRIMGEKSQCC